MVLAVAFYEVALGPHILAVVIVFGATFAYPVDSSTVTRADPRALPFGLPRHPRDQPARAHALDAAGR